MRGDLCYAEGSLNDVIESCVSRMVSLAVSGTKAMSSPSIDFSLAMMASMGLTQGYTKAQSNCNPNDVIIHGRNKCKFHVHVPHLPWPICCYGWSVLLSIAMAMTVPIAGRCCQGSS